jgi:bacterioferritin
MQKEKKEKVIEVLNKARAMELHAIHQYMNQHYNLDDLDYGELAAKVKLICRENGDSVSVKLFERIIDEEQAHFGYFDNISNHIEKLGNTFLARIAGTPADTGPASKGFVTQQAE